MTTASFSIINISLFTESQMELACSSAPNQVYMEVLRKSALKIE